MFYFQLTFRIKSLDDPAIAILISVHSHGTYVPNLSKVYGNDMKVVFARVSKTLFL